MVLALGAGAAVSLLMLLLLPQLLVFLGATISDCRIYAAIRLAGFPIVIGKELFSLGILYFLKYPKHLQPV